MYGPLPHFSGGIGSCCCPEHLSAGSLPCHAISALLEYYAEWFFGHSMHEASRGVRVSSVLTRWSMASVLHVPVIAAAVIATGEPEDVC